MVSGIVILAIATLLSTVAFLALVFGVDVQSVGAWEILLFYASLFLGTAGIVTFSGIAFRRMRERRFAAKAFLPAAFRQGLILSGAAVAALFLQRMGLLSWYAAAGVLAVAVFLEFFLAQVFEAP